MALSLWCPKRQKKQNTFDKLNSGVAFQKS